MIELAPGARTAFLERECANQPSMRKELEKLISADGPSKRDLSLGLGRLQQAVGLMPTNKACANEHDSVGTDSVIGKYQVIRELGHGGMGRVYLARDLELGRLAALKVLGKQSAELSRRLVTEAQTTARCGHENIVVIYEAGQHAGRAFMALEYLKGQTLREWMNERTRARGTRAPGAAIPASRVIELMIPVARALVGAHSMGIVHRDLKPENIMLTESGGIKVLDFGIAKLLSECSDDSLQPTRQPALSAALEGTQPGTLVGTPAYMSPEQLRGERVDHRTDLWAVGIMLYELITGRHPLDPLTMPRLGLVAALDEPMPLVSESVPDVGRLGELIERCLIKRRDDRLATASELVADLDALASRDSTPMLAAGASPFIGLAAFQKSDANRFFGRSRETASVVAKVDSHPLVTLVGPSGAGKSSLLRAGVIPALERLGEGWLCLVLRPGRGPMDALTKVFEELRVDSETAMQPSMSARLRDEPGWFGQKLRTWARRKRRRLVLCIDQFEELYTLVAESDTRAAFVKCLEGAADDASSPLRVVLSIRSDFLDRVVQGSHFTNELLRGLVWLLPMSRTGLRDALTKPVLAAGYRFDSLELVKDMLEAVESTSSALPLLQFAASKLWENRDRERHVLTRASYESFGGVAGALAVHADAVVASMSSAKLRVARSIFERLVTAERTRTLISLSELRELPGNAEDIEQVVHYLADARMVAIESGTSGETSKASTAELNPSGHGDRGSDGSTVELIHESLIDTWPTLRRWLDDSHEDAEFIERLRTA
ncbi:MAG: protein kinase [Proteobacteria bacterium]|nr:protein kinase [Pseudomonadota bacterium]